MVYLYNQNSQIHLWENLPNLRAGKRSQHTNVFSLAQFISHSKIEEMIPSVILVSFVACMKGFYGSGHALWLSYWSLGFIPLWGNSSISAPFLMYASIKIFALEILLGFWPKIILSGHHLQYSWNSIPCFPLFVDFIVHEIFLFPINFQVQLCI